MRRIFVYGTLRRGATNHGVLLRAGARFEGTARTAARYDLGELGPYPAMFDRGARAIDGEVWSVDDAGTADLDRFEGTPDLYVRRSVDLDDGTVAEAYFSARAR